MIKVLCIKSVDHLVAIMTYIVTDGPCYTSLSSLDSTRGSEHIQLSTDVCSC